MSIPEEMPWGTKIEMMPDKRKMFPTAKSYEGIFLGFSKKGGVKVVKNNTSTVQNYHPSFWRPKDSK